MDYNERNGSYSDDELLSRFSRPETPRTTVQDDIPDDPAALRRDRGPRPGIRMASGRPMRGMKMQRPAGRKGGPNYRAALCGAVLAFFVIALLFFVLFMSRGGKIKELNSQIDTLGQDKQSLSAQITSLQQQVDTLTASRHQHYRGPHSAACRRQHLCRTELGLAAPLYQGPGGLSERQARRIPRQLVGLRRSTGRRADLHVLCAVHRPRHRPC